MVTRATMVVLLCLFLLAEEGQAQIDALSFEEFERSKLVLVVLDPEYGPYLKKAVENYWTVKEYQFIEEKDIDRYRDNKDYIFLKYQFLDWERHIYIDRMQQIIHYLNDLIILGNKFKKDNELDIGSGLYAFGVPIAIDYKDAVLDGLFVKEGQAIRCVAMLNEYLKLRMNGTFKRRGMENFQFFLRENFDGSILEKKTLVIEESVMNNSSQGAKLREIYPYQSALVPVADVFRKLINKDENSICLAKVRFGNELYHFFFAAQNGKPLLITNSLRKDVDADDIVMYLKKYFKQ